MKFKVGDQVRLNDTASEASSAHKENIGKVGTVTNIGPYVWPYSVKFPSLKNSIICSESELGVVPTPKSAAGKFKVGDRVRSLLVSDHDNPNGVVTRSFYGRPRDRLYYDVVRDHVRTNGCYLEEELELLPPAPKFKVGDKVRVTGAYGDIPLRVGLVGVLIEVGNLCYRVKLSGQEYAPLFKENELELVEEEKTFTKAEVIAMLLALAETFQSFADKLT